ncbi:MAG TPA: TetR/AcrR family transcriptional regulator [Polyangiaceae bacterium]|jgi:AcrR family transcriptional regulator|nr:TetR/AcrR family transcriptional regulator [Polyangiaceae bacterium]
MARPQSVTDDEVLAAARAVFLEKGVTATVDEVAARCGVGEATVFRRFPTKQALFVAAMDAESEPAWGQWFAERWPPSGDAGVDGVREALQSVANEILATGRKMMPLMLMKMSNPGLWMSRERPPMRVVRATQLLTQFFSWQIESGYISVRDPRVAARIWLGALQHWIMFEAFMKPLDNVPAELFVEELVDLFCAPPVRRKKARRT